MPTESLVSHAMAEGRIDPHVVFEAMAQFVENDDGVEVHLSTSMQISDDSDLVLEDAAISLFAATIVESLVSRFGESILPIPRDTE